MKYQIKTDSSQQQYIHITAEIDVFNEPLRLQFPVWRPGRYELGNFAKNVRSFQVFNHEGSPLMFEKTNADEWLVETNDTRQVLVTYAYYAAEFNAGSTFLDTTRLYVNPVNCLVYVAGRENEACTLEVDLHSKMKYTGTLPIEGEVIIANSYHELVDSPFIFCDDVESNGFEYGGVDFTISFVGVNHVPWERVLLDFQKFTKKQFDDFGAFPVNTFHFIVLVTPYPHYHGVEHLASTIIVLGPTPDIFGDLYDELLGVSSHELYHVWNVKAIRSADLSPYDYRRENFSKMGYLCEGITTYLGDYYLMSSGLWSTERYLKEFSGLIQKHLDNHGRFNYSLAESSWDTWLDGYTLGAPARKVSIYNEGAIFAFLTDIFIRKNSAEQFGLSHLMHKLYHDFYCKGKSISEEDFIAAVSEISGHNFANMFERIVQSRVSYQQELDWAFEYLGLELNLKSNPDLVARLLGVKTILHSGSHKITSILAGSVSDAAGLMIGDSFWAINDHVVGKDLSKWLSYYKGYSLQLILERNSQVVKAQIDLSTVEYFKVVSIKKDAQPSTFNNQAFELWTGLSGVK